MISVPYGIPIDDDDVYFAWGFRAIHDSYSPLDILHDRQGWYKHDETKIVPVDFVNFINRIVISTLKEKAKLFVGDERRRDYYEFTFGDKVVKAIISPNASYGYIYGSVWY